MGDPRALAIALSNLIGNAVKYTPKGGKIRVGVSLRTPGRATVYVVDNGIGISPADQKKVLEGYRTEEARKVAEGTGTGLSVLVKGIVEAHGGSLALQSKPGKGSRFSFDLALSN